MKSVFNDFKMIRSAILLAIFLVTGCSRPVEKTTVLPVAVPQVLPSHTAAPFITNTPTRMPSPKPIFTKTATPSPISTLTVTPTPQPTDTLSPTAIPTLAPDEASALILKLNQGDAGCQLPCWWGITPGKTKGAEAVAFFSIFSPDIYYTRDGGGVDFSFPPRAKKEYYQGVKGFLVSIGNPYGIVTLVEVSNGSGMYESVSKFLIANGIPGEIWIETYAHYPGDIPFVVFLFYPQSGTLAIWDQSIEEFLGDVLTGCMSEGPQLKLWDPKVPLTLQQVLDLFTRGKYPGGEPLLPLAKATNMTVEQFYQTYKDPAVKPCIKTPRNLWPSPFAN